MPDHDPNAHLWERVHAALDARRDPLADPALARALAQHPQTLRQVRALCAALPAPRRGRARRVGLAAAALVAAALPLAPWLERPAPPRAADVALEVVRGAPAPARGAVRRLEPRTVLAWTRTGDRP